METGSIVILHLANPTEKYWGILRALSAPGVTLWGINISSFDDWSRSIAAGDTPALGLVNVFFPLTRVHRMFLDEQVGEVESLCQAFEQRVGVPVREYLDLDAPASDTLM